MRRSGSSSSRKHKAAQLEIMETAPINSRFFSPQTPSESQQQQESAQQQDSEDRASSSTSGPRATSASTSLTVHVAAAAASDGEVMKPRNMCELLAAELKMEQVSPPTHALALNRIAQHEMVLVLGASGAGKNERSQSHVQEEGCGEY